MFCMMIYFRETLSGRFVIPGKTLNFHYKRRQKELSAYLNISSLKIQHNLGVKNLKNSYVCLWTDITKKNVFSLFVEKPFYVQYFVSVNAACLGDMQSSTWPLIRRKGRQVNTSTNPCIRTVNVGFFSSVDLHFSEPRLSVNLQWN